MYMVVGTTGLKIGNVDYLGTLSTLLTLVKPLVSELIGTNLLVWVYETRCRYPRYLKV